MADIPIAHAMLCWNDGFDGKKPSFAIIRHPDGLHASDPYRYSVGACFDYWARLDANELKLRLLIESWHIVAFYSVPAPLVHEGLLAVPEYRDMLATDCLPEPFLRQRLDRERG